MTTDGRRALFVGASRTRGLRVVALDLDSGAVEQLSAAEEELVAAAVRLRAARGRVPDDRRQDGARAVLSAAPPALHGARGRAPAAGGPHPRRPDRARERRRCARRSSSSPAAGSPSSTSTTAAAPGYGREYRDRLRGRGGSSTPTTPSTPPATSPHAGAADRARMTITGGSAGGWTVLCALACYPDAFAVGADYFGVGRPDGVRRGHPQVRVALHRVARRSTPRTGRERSPVNHADAIARR